MAENTKLTLSINRRIIQKARIISKKRKKSISALFEEYIHSLDTETTDLKKEALWRLKNEPLTLPKNFNFKNARASAYQKKLQ